MSKSILAAQAGGFYSLMGQISKGTGNTINLPEGMLNIGGNSKGYLLESKTDWNPAAAENNDGSFSAMALGDDIYIYAVQQATGVAKWVASKNATYPTGYSATDSRKVGGFHFGRTRPVAQKYVAAFTCPVEIIPNSCWDLQHRPTCDPAGMVEFAPGKWCDIYLASQGTGTGLEAVPRSKYNAVPITGTEGYNYTDLHKILHNAGKRAPSYWEFCTLAYGVPQGATGQSGRINTGMTTGYGFNPVSCANVDQPSGNIWQVGSEMFDRGDAAGAAVPEGWNDSLNTGIDSARDAGQWYGFAMRMALYGASWASAAGAGSRAVLLDNGPWGVNPAVGARGVCDSL